jgi:hypothetical protein
MEVLMLARRDSQARPRKTATQCARYTATDFNLLNEPVVK